MASDMRMEFRLDFIDKSINAEVPRIDEKHRFKVGMK